MIDMFPGFENPNTQWRLPHLIYHGLRDYLKHGDCGNTGFLYAVLTNDLNEAVFRADTESSETLAAIVKFVWHEMPAGCHGSKEHVARWRRKFERANHDTR